MILVALVLLLARPLLAADLAASTSHSLAAKDDGTVWSWGDNSRNQLGYDTGGQPVLKPRQVPNLSGIVAVAASRYSSVALDNQGRVWWWGDTQPTPVMVPSPAFQSIREVDLQILLCGSARYDVIWGLTSGGTVVGWDLASKSVMSVTGFTGAVRSIAARGTPYNYALQSDQTVWAWAGCPGLSYFTSTTVARPLPAGPYALTGTTAISANFRGMHAQTSDGVCVFRVLGDQGNTLCYPQFGPYATMYAENEDVFAIDASKTLWGWSRDQTGQLGNYPATTTRFGFPDPATPFTQIGPVERVALSGYGVLAAGSDGRVWGWGLNASGQLGRGTVTTRLVNGVPVAYENVPAPIPDFTLAGSPTPPPPPPPPPPPTPPPTPSGSASFIRVDTTTQGSWKGQYGADGFALNSHAAAYPNTAQVTVADAGDYVWSSSTSDPRAVQKTSAADRIASTWYSGNITIRLNLADGATRQVALYALDWDGNGSRAQRFEIRDAGGTLLDSRTSTGFQGGHYLVWALRGQVTISIIQLAGANAVVSGIFFDPAGPTTPNPPTTAEATFVKADTTTRGSWKGVYGAEGLAINSHAAAYPGYATTSISNGSDYVWAPSTQDSRALQTTVGSSRIASTWYSNSHIALDLNLTDGATHRVAIYAVDWDGNGQRAQSIEIRDSTGRLLDSRTLERFEGGHYLVWAVRGHVTIKIAHAGRGANAVMSGIFFDRY